ncbi:MAG: beta-lactamase, partial [Caulobacteraceae bacterium]|nr:beta-lactamase [Caulobacteraceae bacterium]
DVRHAAMERYVTDPYDGAQPVAIVEALARLKRGQLLSTANSAWMIDTMMANTTGHSRLRAGAPRDWDIGDKTGTGQDWDGASVGINDIALMTAPDGRTYAVAVMIQRTKQGLESRRRFMQSVSRAVVDHWRESDEANPTAQAAAAAPRKG